jgi:hypothetical protein
MRRCTVNSSDLATARALTLRLAGRGPFPADHDGCGPSSSEPGRERAPAIAAAPPPVPSVPEEFQSWEVLLAWALELCRSHAAFVVDGQGFVIASRGNTPADGFDGVGAELCFGMEQLDRIDPAAGTLETMQLHFEGHMLVGMKVRDEAVGTFILGLVGSRSLPDAVRQAVLRQARYTLPHLA